MFYIESGLFLRNFDYLDVLIPYKNGQMNTQLKIPPVELKNDFQIFQMLVKSPGNYQIAISQPGVLKSGLINFKYVSLMLVKPPEHFDIYAFMHDKSYQKDVRNSANKALYFGGIAYCSRDVIINPDLEPGSYLIFVLSIIPILTV